MKFWSFTFGLLFAFAASAQHAATFKPFILGMTEELQSAELGEKRILNIYLPDGYSADSSVTYPVVYILDGSANEDFIHLAGLVQFLVMAEKMPPSIVVGIANIDRKRDFTFPTSIAKDKQDFPTTGGSEQFIRFLENELQPFIQSRYKANASKTIVGQSLGGLLATEILLKKPGLFTDYLIVSPSLWWDNESLLANAPELLKAAPKDLNIYIAVGKEGKVMEKDAARLAKTLKKSGQAKVHFLYLPKENHATILHNGAYQGLELLNQKD